MHPPDSALPLERDPRFLTAIAHFQAGDFDEAADGFEELFFEAIRDELEFVRVFLQVSAGVFHAQCGQRRPAVERLEEGVRAIERVTSDRGFDLDLLRRGVLLLSRRSARGCPSSARPSSGAERQADHARPGPHASVPAVANAPARQSSSFHPPKSSAVARTPQNSDATTAVRHSNQTRRGRPGRMIRAITAASAPAAIQSAIPIDGEITKLLQLFCAGAPVTPRPGRNES
jgi:Domain of unknown function (DUF309).